MAKTRVSPGCAIDRVRSAWAQPWGVTPSESRAPARLLALARRNAIRRARRAGRRGAGPSEIAQHRISMCPSCLPVPARASSRLAHSPPSRAINAGPTLGQRAPHATPVGTSRDRRYGRESYPNLLLKYSTLEGGRERLRSTVDFFQIARAHRQYVTCSQHKFFTPTGAGEGPQDYTCFTYVLRAEARPTKVETIRVRNPNEKRDRLAAEDRAWCGVRPATTARAP